MSCTPILGLDRNLRAARSPASPGMFTGSGVPGRAHRISLIAIIEVRARVRHLLRLRPSSVSIHVASPPPITRSGAHPRVSRYPVESGLTSIRNPGSLTGSMTARRVAEPRVFRPGAILRQFRPRTVALPSGRPQRDPG